MFWFKFLVQMFSGKQVWSQSTEKGGKEYDTLLGTDFGGCYIATCPPFPASAKGDL